MEADTRLVTQLSAEDVRQKWEEVSGTVLVSFIRSSQLHRACCTIELYGMERKQ